MAPRRAGYMQMTTAQEDAWESDANAYVADEEEVNTLLLCFGNSAVVTHLELELGCPGVSPAPD